MSAFWLLLVEAFRLLLAADYMGDSVIVLLDALGFFLGLVGIDFSSGLVDVLVERLRFFWFLAVIELLVGFGLIYTGLDELYSWVDAVHGFLELTL